VSKLSVEKSLDRKLAAIHADPHGCREFLLADAKDADMAFGLGAPGLSPERHDGELRFRTLEEYREQMRQILRQGLVDILLMSASSGEVLALQERLFDNSHVTPAIRANDATDVHAIRGSVIPLQAAQPFRTASLDHVQCGYLDCVEEERARGVNLGLYSVTFNNDVDLDRATLQAYNEFRDEAERKGFRHFLEVFHPNVPGAVAPDQLVHFINDAIARTLAGVTSSARPLFLKIPYPGPRALEDLVAYDPHLIVGVLGGSSGTTRDAFQLLADAKKHGARIALFGRKINNAENQLAFIEFLRLIADGELEAEEAVRAYHAVLQKLKVRPHRSLEEDLQTTETALSYAGGPPSQSGGQPSEERKPTLPSGAHPTPAPNPGGPRFSEMTAEERLAYHRNRLRQQFGG
jgi:hypothetical protein